MAHKNICLLKKQKINLFQLSLNKININYLTFSHFLTLLWAARFWNCIPINLPNSWNPSMNYLLLPYFIIASLGLVLKRSIAFMYSGFEKSLFILEFDSTLFIKSLFIHYFLVSSRYWFIFIAYWTSLISSGFLFVTLSSGIFYFFGSLVLGPPPERKPFLNPPNPSFFLVFSIYF